MFKIVTLRIKGSVSWGPLNPSSEKCLQYPLNKEKWFRDKLFLLVVFFNIPFVYWSLIQLLKSVTLASLDLSPYYE